MIKINKDISYKGYSIAPHYLMHLVREKRISMTSFGWLTVFINIANFDPRNPQYYGCITRTPSEIGKSLNTDPTTVTRQQDILLKANLLETHSPDNNSELLKITHYWMFDYKVAMKMTKKNFQGYKEVESYADNFEPVIIPDGLADLPKQIESLPGYSANLHPSLPQKQSHIFSRPNKSEYIGSSSNGVIEAKEIKANEIKDPNCPFCNSDLKTTGEVCKKCAQEIDECLGETNENGDF